MIGKASRPKRSSKLPVVDHLTSDVCLMLTLPSRALPVPAKRWAGGTANRRSTGSSGSPWGRSRGKVVVLPAPGAGSAAGCCGSGSGAGGSGSVASGTWSGSGAGVEGAPCGVLSSVGPPKTISGVAPSAEPSSSVATRASATPPAIASTATSAATIALIGSRREPIRGEANERPARPRLLTNGE